MWEQVPCLARHVELAGWVSKVYYTATTPCVFRRWLLRAPVGCLERLLTEPHLLLLPVLTRRGRFFYYLNQSSLLVVAFDVRCWSLVTESSFLPLDTFSLFADRKSTWVRVFSGWL